MTDDTRPAAAHPVKAALPQPIWRAVRSLGTALLTPVAFSLRTGHLRSSFQNMAVAADGSALPWYTYPCIDFLAQRDFTDRNVLEFGAGQSSLWWSAHAKTVTSLEGDAGWHEHIKSKMPANVDLSLVPSDDCEISMAAVRQTLAERATAKFDVVIIDGLWRRELVQVAFEHVTDDGVIIFDNADGYGLYDETKDRDRQRVDFFGFAPGVSQESCTSIFFKPGAFLFSPRFPIPKIGATRAR